LNLFEINQEIASCIDFDTGEIIDEEKLKSLQLDKHEKRRGYVFAIMNMTAAAKALHEQEVRFKQRRQATEKTVEWLKKTLQEDLDGETMHEAEFDINFRTVRSVNITDISKIPQKFLKHLEAQADKAALKTAIVSGTTIEGAELVDKKVMVIR